MHGPFECIEALQVALDAWREEYNTTRPHQSLAMGFPASRFTPAASPLALRIPVQLTAEAGQPKRRPAPNPLPADSPAAEPVTVTSGGHLAVEVDRIVPASGNLQIGGQQVWLGPALAGRQVTLWVNEISLHVLADGTRIKTLPSRLGITELARSPPMAPAPLGPRRCLPVTGR